MKTFLYIFGLCGAIIFGSKYYDFNSKKFSDDLVDLVTVYYPHHKSATQSIVYNADFGVFTNYKIKFSNGTLIEYGENGKVIFAESYDNDIIPIILLPKHIQKYLKKHHSGINVIRYSANYNKKEYIVILENNIKLHFLKNKCS